MTISRIASLAALVVVSACDVGSFGMSMGDDDDTGIDISVCKDRLATPATAHPHTAPVVATDPSNSGQSCVSANCHLASAPGAGAPAYQAGGTLYSDAAGTTPNAGAWIRMKSATKTIETVTDAAGNFWFQAPNTLDPPVSYQTAATFCGGTMAVDAVAAGVTKMIAPIASGNCNSSSCHGKVAGATNVLYLQ